MPNESATKRIEWIDTAKAIAILTVIIGHCYWIKEFELIHYVIYSFHMPLFFIVSGFFAKELPIKKSVPKFFQSYIKPLLLTSLFALVLVLIGDWIRSESYLETIKSWCRYAVYMNGNYEPENLTRLGPLWFLYALFWGSLIFAYILKYDSINTLSISVALLFIAVFVYKFRGLPFAFAEGLLSVFFLLLGRYINKNNVIDENKLNLTAWIAITVVWLLSIPLGPFFFKTISFGKSFITVIGAIAGTLIIFRICKYIKTNKLKWIGMNTLHILCGHVLSFNLLKCIGLNYNNLPFNCLLNFVIESICQIMLALTLGFILTLIPFYRKK